MGELRNILAGITGINVQRSTRAALEMLIATSIPLWGWMRAQGNGLVGWKEDSDRCYRHPLHGLWEIEGGSNFDMTPIAPTGAVAARLGTLKKRVPKSIRFLPEWGETRSLGTLLNLAQEALEMIVKIPRPEDNPEADTGFDSGSSLVSKVGYEKHFFLRPATDVDLKKLKDKTAALTLAFKIEGFLLEYRWREGIFRPSAKMDIGHKGIFCGTGPLPMNSMSSIELWTGEEVVDHPNLGKWILWGNSCRPHRVPWKPKGELAELLRSSIDVFYDQRGLYGLDEQELHRVGTTLFRQI
jgi:hypothetical protein